MSILHVFDMDGTLLRSTSGLEIARAFGRVAELEDLERSFTAGTVSTYEFAVAMHGMYAGLTADAVADIFRACPWMDGIPRVLADIRSRGEYSAVVTMSPDFFAGLLVTIGVDEVHASRFPELPLRRSPDRSAVLAAADKVAIVETMLARRGLSPDRCIAYGDSASDLPLFRALRHTVAVNATPRLRAAALLCRDGDDLWEIYQAARAAFTPGGWPADAAAPGDWRPGTEAARLAE